MTHETRRDLGSQLASARRPPLPGELTVSERANGARLLTAEDLASRWQVPRSHVYRLAREDKLPVVRLGRYRRFRLAEIEAFEAAGGVAADG